MTTIEEMVKNQFIKYFESTAYKKNGDARYNALQVMLNDLIGYVKSGKLSTYGLSAPSRDDIARITDCSTCAGKAAKTNLARNRCETFARSWMKISGTDIENEISINKRIIKPEQKQVNKNRFKTESEEKNPKKTFFNVQAFK